MNPDLLKRLDATEAVRFTSLTLLPWRSLPAKAAMEGPVIAIGLSLIGRPVGFGLAELCPQQGCGHVHSIAVVPDYRRRGVGAALLARLENEILRHGYTKAGTSYLPHAPSAPAFERMLHNSGWESPRPEKMVCRLDGEGAVRLMQTPWFTCLSLPAAFSVFPWVELKAEDKQRLLAAHEREPVWEEGLDPFRGIGKPEPVNSLGLLYQGEVVGWMLTERLAPGLLRYTNLFVRQEHRSAGLGIVLLAEAIRRQWEHEGHLAYRGGLWQTLCSNALMVRFTKRYLAPYLAKIVETVESRKSLTER